MMTATMVCQQICLLLSALFCQEAIAVTALKDSIRNNLKSSRLSEILSGDFDTNNARDNDISIPSLGPSKRDEPYSGDYGPGMPYSGDYGPGMPYSGYYGSGMPYSAVTMDQECLTAVTMNPECLTTILLIHLFTVLTENDSILGIFICN
ncbi:hypothetical protein PoB_005048800 [Plakobranchus ocellatus]|uniref:Uncharacterized protein n=1 Tax=Plakobranchus ocellatus TaxID=259542 RepID=A0AAV4BYV7_9GAST|nr:hypothetical protein PoB_005048800 [Plakobranchus ocellatus]